MNRMVQEVETTQDFFEMQYMHHEAALAQLERLERSAKDPKKVLSDAFKKYARFHWDMYKFHYEVEEDYVHAAITKMAGQHGNAEIQKRVEDMIHDHELLETAYAPVLAAAESGQDLQEPLKHYADLLRKHVAAEDALVRGLEQNFFTPEGIKILTADIRTHITPQKFKLIAASFFTSLSDERQQRLKKILPRPFLIMAKLVVGDMRKTVAELDAE